MDIETDEYFEKRLSWAHLIDACQKIESCVDYKWPVPPYNTVISICRKFNARACRDWLHSQHITMPYEIFGLYMPRVTYTGLWNMPVLVRFQLQDEEDNLLFSLRWL
jgi:hypothetical protein